jgi:hypothetical protein
MTRRVPMPSPRGTNAAGLFITSAGGFGFACDQAPAAMGSKMRDAVVRHLCRAGVDDETINRFLELCEGEQAEDDEDKSGYVDGEWVANVQEPRAGKPDGFVDIDGKPRHHDGKKAKDHLPTYKSNGMPDNDLDNLTRPRQAMDNSPRAIAALARRSTKIGPVY